MRAVEICLKSPRGREVTEREFCRNADARHFVGGADQGYPEWQQRRHATSGLVS